MGALENSIDVIKNSTGRTHGEKLTECINIICSLE